MRGLLKGLHAAGVEPRKYLRPYVPYLVITPQFPAKRVVTNLTACVDHGFAPVRDRMPSTEVQKLRSFVTFALDKLDAKEADLHDGSPEEDFQELVCRPAKPYPTLNLPLNLPLPLTLTLTPLS